MILAAFLFMRNMIKSSAVSSTTKDFENGGNGDVGDLLDNYTIPKNVEVFEITGPLFFGAAYKFKEANHQRSLQGIKAKGNETHIV
jgi:sulfate permease, SulP family